MRVVRGIDLDAPDEVTEQEIETFRSSYADTHGGVLDAYEFWLEFNPRVVKSHRIQAYFSASDVQRDLPLHGTLGFLHLYTVMGYEAGIRYEVNHSRALGATKAAVLQAIEIAFIHCGPRGIDAARSAARDLLAAWVEPGPDETMRHAFPDEWTADAEAFHIDLDMTTADLVADEKERIRAWYVDRAGEVPGWVEVLSAGRPGLLKAYLDRVARAMMGPLPRQMFPFLQLQLYAARGNSAGVTESARLGRGLGMTSDQLYEAAAWGVMYGGPSALSNVDTDVLAF